MNFGTGELRHKDLGRNFQKFYRLKNSSKNFEIFPAYFSKMAQRKSKLKSGISTRKNENFEKFISSSKSGLNEVIFEVKKMIFRSKRGISQKNLQFFIQNTLFKEVSSAILGSKG